MKEPLTQKEQLAADEAKEKLERMVKVRWAGDTAVINLPTAVPVEYHCGSQTRGYVAIGNFRVKRERERAAAEETD